MAVDYFLKLDGIQGESEDAAHKDEIQIMSWSWGASQVSSVSGTGGSGAGKADLSDFSIMTNFDKGTPKFFKSICEGAHIKTGTMTAIKSGANNKPYLKVDFKELFVSSLQISASSEIPTVSISFTYNEIKVDYSVQNEQGNLTSTGAVTYNLKQNKLT
ncbi:Hcp family type VI secretion system effector [Paracidobacterium acidisoli]|uniref:Hcp1 family type VI secretion system effector n=1 Tax=Paracidobacterium acidisoli TaxID=2303751 RepID=A0A372IRE2_9BACT|nr:type VI secretion system tube protein Hcp [Paracidobacterium acidisoli]MBT9330200.1 type VI secretion system tube protein Hcp [Paracidobacterium acidisoli]